MSVNSETHFLLFSSRSWNNIINCSKLLIWRNDEIIKKYYSTNLAFKCILQENAINSTLPIDINIEEGSRNSAKMLQTQCYIHEGKTFIKDTCLCICRTIFINGFFLYEFFKYKCKKYLHKILTEF